MALKSSCTPICPVSISCVYPIYPRLPVIQPALGEEADGEKGEGAGGGEGEEDGGGEDAGGGEGSEVSGAVDNREPEDITVADQQPAARARTLRPVAGGAVAWTRSESEAEDGGALLPVKRHGAKRVRIEYGETGGAGSSRGQRGLLSQLKSGGGLQSEQGRQEEDARANLCSEGGFSDFTVPSTAARGRGGAKRGRGRATAGAERGHAGRRGAGRRGAGRGAALGGAVGRVRVSKRPSFFWFPSAVAGCSPNRKRQRSESEKAETDNDDGSSEDNLNDDDPNEENDHSSTDSDIESEEALHKAFKESRKKIVARKREMTRRSRMIVEAAKIMNEAGNSQDDDQDQEGDYEGDDEDYLPPQAKPRKTTRGPGRRSFLSLHVR